MNGISTQARHIPTNVNNTQSVDLPPQPAANPIRDGNVKARFVDNAAHVNTNQIPQLAAPSVSLNPSATNEAVNTLTRATSNYFRFPEKDAVALADRALIESMQDRLRANRDKQAMQNTLGYECSKAQSQAQKDEGTTAVWGAIASATASVVTAAAGAYLETKGNNQQHQGEIGIGNIEALPKTQAEFDALPNQQFAERQELLDSPAARDWHDLQQRPGLDLEADARGTAFEAELNALDQLHANNLAALGNKVDNLARKVADLPLEAAKVLINTGKTSAITGSVFQRNVSPALNELAQGVTKTYQSEHQSDGTMAGARANLVASMAQETGKEGDSDNNLISQIIDAMNKRNDMLYNTLNFFTQKM